MKTLLTGAFVCLAIIAGWLEVTQPGIIKNSIPEYYYHR